MKNRWEIFLFFLFLTCMFTSGVILISQGVSFARWNEGMPINYFIDKHAELLALSGVGLIAAAHWCMRLHSRLYKLEQVISDQQPRVEVD